MGRRDLGWAALLGAGLTLLFARALVDPGAALANFGDLYAYHVPLQHLASSRLAAGQLPFWNPYILIGVPHLADPQTMLFYPPAVLLRLFGSAWAFTILSLGHAALAAWGAQLLARRLGAAPSGAAALGAAYALSPFVAGRILQGVPTLLFALAWGPWCWLALLERRPWLLAGTWALQGLSGHPQFAALNALAMGFWAAADPRGRGRAFALAAVGAAALAAVQAVPSAELLSRSSRRGLPEAFASAYRMPWKALRVVFSPRPFGDPRDGTFAGDPSEWFEEYTLHLGAAPLAAAAVGAAAVPAARAALGLAAAGAFFAAGPSTALSRVSARFGVWTLWGLWLAAAFGWAVLARGNRFSGAALAALALAQAFVGGADLVGTEPAGPYLAANRAVASSLGGRLERAMTAPDLPNADKTMLYRIMNVNGYAAYYPVRQALFAYAAEGGRPAADPGRLYFSTPDSAGARSLGVASVIPGPAGAPFARVAGSAALARTPGGPAALSSPRPELWSARGVGPGPLTFAMPEEPGWRAWVDGRPVRAGVAEGLFLSVDVPPSTFKADFRYQPPGWSLLCLGGLLAWGAWARAGRRFLYLLTS